MTGTTRKRYRPKPYRIVFEEGHDLEDLEVLARRMSIGELLELMSVADLAQGVADGTVTAPTDEHKQAVEKMITQLAGAITWWNVDQDDPDDPEGDGIPVAPDEAGLRAQDFTLVMAVFSAYFDRVVSVMPPLPSGSPDGPSPGELGSIPTETLPPSPSS